MTGLASALFHLARVCEQNEVALNSIHIVDVQNDLGFVEATYPSDGGAMTVWGEGLNGEGADAFLGRVTGDIYLHMNPDEARPT